MTIKEEWRTIQTFPNYQVSNLGNVRNTLTNKLLTPYDAGNGYMRIGLTRDGKKHQFYVHRLVCVAFRPNPEKKETVNHLNGIKNDNRLSNLEFATYKEQQADIQFRRFFSYEEPEPKLTRVDITMYFQN